MGPMDLYGDNRAFGSERTELCDKRWVDPASGEGEAFPRGTANLLQVVTVRKDGSQRTAFAFRVGGKGDVPAEASAEPDGTQVEERAGDVPASEVTPESAQADEAGEVSAPAPSESDPQAVEALKEAVDLVNRMLDQAGELARHEFGYVGGIQVGVPQEGAGYTYVTVVARDAHGQPSAAPLHLHMETSNEPGCPDSLSSKIEYSLDGTPLRLLLVEYGDQYSCRVVVNVNEKSGKLSVQKVEEFKGAEQRPHLLYKRGWTPGSKEDGEGGRGSRDRDRGGFRGRDERQGGRGDGRREGRGPRGGERERWDDRGWDDRGGRGGWRDDDRRSGDHDRGSRWGSRSDAARQGGRDERRGWDDRSRDDRGGRGDWRAEREGSHGGWDRSDRGGRGDWGRRDADGREGRSWRDADARSDREDRRSEGRWGAGDRDARGDRPGRSDWRSDRDARDGGSRGPRGDRGSWSGDRGGRDRGPRDDRGGSRGRGGDDRRGRRDSSGWNR